MSTPNETSVENKEKSTFTHKTKVEKVPMKLDPGNNPVSCPVTEGSGLSEPIVVMITSGKSFQQLVVTRPVGHTSLPDDSWVIHRTEDIKRLISASEDPSAKEKDKRRREIRNEAMNRIGLMTKDDKGRACYKFPTGRLVVLAQVESDAKAAYDKAEMEARSAYEEECKSNDRKPKKNWKFGMSVNAFKSEEVRAFETSAKKTLAEDATYKAGIESIPKYETLGGQYGDQKQSAANVYGKNRTQEQMVDVIMNSMLTAMDGTGVVGIPQSSKVRVAFDEAGRDPDKLIKFIEQFAFPGFTRTNT